MENLYWVFHLIYWNYFSFKIATNRFYKLVKTFIAVTLFNSTRVIDIYFIVTVHYYNIILSYQQHQSGAALTLACMCGTTAAQCLEGTAGSDTQWSRNPQRSWRCWTRQTQPLAGYSVASDTPWSLLQTRSTPAQRFI